MANTVLVSLGSNIEPTANLPAAVDRLARCARIEAVSRVFETEPVGDRSMPSFLNAALKLVTGLGPEELKFDVLWAIEADLGRVRTEDRNAPRTIDIDIALFGDLVLRDEKSGIEIPEPDVLRFAHVAVPLADVAPDFRHPIDGRTLAEIADELDDLERVRPAADQSLLARSR